MNDIKVSLENIQDMDVINICKLAKWVAYLVSYSIMCNITKIKSLHPGLADAQKLKKVLSVFFFDR